MSADRNIPDHVARLLASSIESVERLDVLLHIRETPERSFSARAIAAVLRISTPSAEQHLAILCGRGFLAVSIGTDLLYAYQPLSPMLEEVLAEVTALYRERPADVAAALGAPPSPS